MKPLLSLIMAPFFCAAVFADPAPTVTVVPAAVCAKPVGTTTLKASVAGGVNPRLQWRFNGHNLTGETGQYLTVHNFYSNIGDYDVLAECDNGIASSSLVRFTLQPQWDDQVVLRYRFDSAPLGGHVADAAGKTSGNLFTGPVAPQACTGPGAGVVAGISGGRLRPHRAMESGHWKHRRSQSGSWNDGDFLVKLPAVPGKFGRVGDTY